LCAEPFCSLCLVTIKGAQYCGDCKMSAIKEEAMAGAGIIGDCAEASEALKYALVGIICCQIILGPIAIAKALKAKQIIAENPRLGGSGKATAALIIGIVDTILGVVAIILRISAAGNRGPW
jgi:hypothetical protein